MSHDQISSDHDDQHDSHHYGNTDSVSKRCLFLVTLIGTAYTMVFLFENWPSTNGKVLQQPTLTLSRGERFLASSVPFVDLLRNLDKWYNTEINADHHDDDHSNCKCVCDNQHDDGHDDNGHGEEIKKVEKAPAKEVAKDQPKDHKSGSGKSDLLPAKDETMKIQPAKVLKVTDQKIMTPNEIKVEKDDKKNEKVKKPIEDSKDDKKKLQKMKEKEKKDGKQKQD